MDKRFLVAFLVSLLILIGYPHYLKWIGVTPEQKKGYEQNKVVSAREEPPHTKPRPASATTILFKNELYEILFSNRGAAIALLKQADTTFYKSGPEDRGIFGIKVLYEGENLYDETFQAAPASAEGQPPQFYYERPGEYRMVKRYFVGNERPTLVLEVELENLSDREKNFSMALEYGLRLDLTNHQDEPLSKALVLSGDRFFETKLSSIKKNPSVVIEPIVWHGLARKYYTILLKPDIKTIGQETTFTGEALLSELKFSPLTVAPGAKTAARILIYAGPQSYEMLKSFGFGFERTLSHGRLGFLKAWLLNGLNFFHRWTGNYGAAILLITLLVKLLFTPLTHMSYESMRKMQALQPKVKTLQKQHHKDPTRLNKELMELYRRNRVNPMTGCLPLVIQIPIFIAFYQVLSEAVELKDASFVWWIHDLSEPDRLLTLPANLPFIGNAFNLLPILMIGSMLWQQKLTPQTAADPMQAKMMYLMPIVFGFVFYNLPSGLVLYWLVNNLLTIFHQLFIKRIPVILHHEDS